jgi:hypothetical protein
MNKKKKLISIFILLLVFVMSSYSQTVLVSTEYLTKKFEDFVKSVPREEIFVHSDREAYVSGEEFWFSIYLIDRTTLKPCDESRIAYFEVLNYENKPIIQKRVLLNGGFGSGQFILPDSLSTGKYTIRAYTNWMKNFLPYNCFIKEIKIFNVFANTTFKDFTFLPAVEEPDHSRVNNKKTVKIESGKNNNGSTEFSFIADDARPSGNTSLNVIIQTHGRIDFSGSVNIVNGTGKLFIPDKKLSEGINQITAFSPEGIPVGEKYQYTPIIRKKISVSIADSCKNRIKLSFGIEGLEEKNERSGSSNISISVSQDLSQENSKGIADYLVFGSEFGLSPDVLLKGRPLDKLNDQELDEILRGLKSNWIDWNQIVFDSMPNIKYLKETNENYIYGQIVNTDQKPVTSWEYILISIPGKVASFQYAKTDREGYFSFAVNIDNDVNDYIVQPSDMSENKRILVRSQFSGSYFPLKSKIVQTEQETLNGILKWVVNYQVRKIYGSESFGKIEENRVNKPQVKRFYGKPDMEIVLADYIKLPVMQEVFFELVPIVFLKNKKHNSDFYVVDPVKNEITDIPAFLLIDGVPVSEPSFMLNLDPEIVEKIDVVQENYQVGDFVFYGIINVITKRGDFENVNLPSYALKLRYRSVDLTRAFISPEYNSVNLDSRIPDVRTTLYWNPSIQKVKDGSEWINFWSSDDNSEYLINIQGINSKGELISFQRNLRLR